MEACPPVQPRSVGRDVAVGSRTLLGASWTAAVGSASDGDDVAAATGQILRAGQSGTDWLAVGHGDRVE